MFRVRWIAALLLVAAIPAQADVTVENAKLRLLPGNLPAAGYFDLRNNGDQPVVLTGGSSDAFAEVMMHRSTLKDGVASMQHLSQVEVPAGSKLSFASGGYHLMLMQHQRTLALGDQVNVTLNFSDGRSVPIIFTAVAPTAP